MFITKQDNYKLQSELSLRKVARTLRQRSTLAEQKLWQQLRNKQINGIKFRRQHTLRGYIVDFYCYQYNLVIEIDGPIHNDHVLHDQGRDRHLKNYGYNILRFSNEQVLNHTREVVKIITEAISPSPV